MLRTRIVGVSGQNLSILRVYSGLVFATMTSLATLSLSYWLEIVLSAKDAHHADILSRALLMLVAMTILYFLFGIPKAILFVVPIGVVIIVLGRVTGKSSAVFFSSMGFLAGMLLLFLDHVMFKGPLFWTSYVPIVVSGCLAGLAYWFAAEWGKV